MFNKSLNTKCDSQEFHRHKGSLHLLTVSTNIHLTPRTIKKDEGQDRRPKQASFVDRCLEERILYHSAKNTNPVWTHLPTGTKAISCWGNRRKSDLPRAGRWGWWVGGGGWGGVEETVEIFYHWEKGQGILSLVIPFKNTK